MVRCMDGARAQPLRGIFASISTTRYTSAFSRRISPEVFLSLSPKRGSRECRMRAASAVSCAMGRTRKRTRAYRAAENIRHSLRNGFTAYGALTPEYLALLASVVSRNPALRPGRAVAPPKDLTPTIEASGPHAFAVRFDTARQHVL